MAKRGLCILLALAAVFSLSAPALAEEEATAEDPVVTEEPVEEPEEVVEEVAEPGAEPETAATSGTCSDGLTWTLSDDGTLTISGTGAMEDYYFVPAPWYSYRTSTRRVIIDYGVTSIGESAFSGYDNLASVTIPEGVISIGYGAFEDCVSLANVTIPSSLTSVGKNAFSGTLWEKAQGDFLIINGILLEYRGSASAVTIPLGVTNIAADAFSERTFITSVSIPNSVVSIGDGAFYDCSSLTSVTIPSSITSIGKYAFLSCDSLRSVTIEGGVKVISEGAFCGCSELRNVVISGNGTSIGEEAFAGSVKLTNITLQDGVAAIGPQAFRRCSSLTDIVFPSSVTSIGTAAFYDCSSLANVTVLNSSCDIAEGVTINVGDSAGDTSKHENYVFCTAFPESATIIGYKGSSAETYAITYNYAFWDVTVPRPTATPAPTPKPTNTPKPGTTPTPTAVPTFAAPKVKIEKVSTGIKVSWNKIDGAPRYMVYYKEGSGSWKKIGTTTATTYTRKAADLKNGVKYTFTVRCCANDKKTMLSGYKASNSITHTVDLAAPTVKISKVSNGIKVGWNKVASSPRYMVYYKEGNGAWKKIGTTTATSYTRTAANLKNGTTYTFTVRCCAGDKKTLLSGYKASNSLQFIVTLIAPTVTISQVSAGIEVSWNKITGSPRYMVYYKENGGGWKKIGTTTSTTYTRAAKYLKNDVKYQFTVRCCANDKKTLLGPYKASNSLKYTK